VLAFVPLGFEADESAIDLSAPPDALDDENAADGAIKLVDRFSGGCPHPVASIIIVVSPLVSVD
jgi:hypothetical protein